MQWPFQPAGSSSYPRWRRLTVLERRIPPADGVSLLRGQAWVHYQRLQLRLEIFGEPSTSNHGPPLYETQIVAWSPRSDPPEAARHLLEAAMDAVEARLRGRDPSLFLGTFHLDVCDPNREEGFLERVCSSCTCWYCEISHAWRP